MPAPLSPAVLYILLALAAEDRHGYGIMQDVTRQTGGQYKIGPGTLYDNLQNLLEQGLIDEVNSRKPDSDSRRRYYRLTAAGRRTLASEVARLDVMLREAKLHLRLADGGGSR